MTALRRARLDDAAITDRIVMLINDLTVEDLDARGAWQPLADLSSRTTLEAVDVEPGSIVLNEQRFEAIANIYVMLIYGADDDGASLSDEYIATITGTIDRDHPVIEAVAVDVSPFYA